MRAALFPYVWRYGEQCHGANGRPGESSPRRGVVVSPVPVQGRLRRWRLLTMNFRQPRVLVIHCFDYDLQLTRH
jgi:hypothetical protein